MSALFKSMLLLLLITIPAGSLFGQSYPVGDFDEDMDVDVYDLLIFGNQWMDPLCDEGGCSGDLSFPDGVNLADYAVFAEHWGQRGDSLIISEFMANNGASNPPEPNEILDEDEDSSDWIEIFNPTDVTINLGGWYLTDNMNDSNPWRFPDGLELGSQEFLIVFASQKNRSVAGEELHTDFNLDADKGEYLALLADDGETVIYEYAPTFPEQLRNISYGLKQNGRTLIGASTTTSRNVPNDTEANADWTSFSYDDSQWQKGPGGLRFWSGGEARIAYNDVIFQTGQHIGTNVTTYGVGSGYSGTSSGPLLDQATGEDMGVNVSLTTNGVDWQDNPSYGGRDCAAGTDAHTTFAAMTDMTGVLTYGGAGWWVDATFTGLDPLTEYTFAASASRGNYDDRITRYTISGADTYTNSSTSGVNVVSGDKVEFDTGGNYAEGYVARWSGITAADGTFKVRAEASPDNPNGQRAYSFDVFMLQGGFGGSELMDQMVGVNASLWTRTEFDMDENEPETYESLALRVKYEDGFVAYLNGVEVARDNISGTPSWNSTADGNRDDLLAADYVSFDISSYRYLLREGKNVLAVLAANDNVSNEKFVIFVELAAAGSTGVAQYLTAPTPGEYNISGSAGIVGDTNFSVDRGFYENPFTVAITSETEGVTINYTTDGSLPSEVHGTRYTGPITITRTTTLRAIAFKPGWISTNVDTQTYIFIADVITQSPNGEKPTSAWPNSGVNGQQLNYGMDPDICSPTGRYGAEYAHLVDDALLAIPTMSLVTDLDNLFNSSTNPSVGGIYVNAEIARANGRQWEKHASLELINPDGSKGFQINCGIRIRGGYSRSDSNPKHAFRVMFRSEYGESRLRYPLFGNEGADSFEKVDIRCSQNYSWAFSGDSNNSMVREVFSRDMHGAMGHPTTKSRYYHLYINGHYWGLYMTQERADARFAASYLGGSVDDYDAIKTEWSQGRRMWPTDGNRDAFERLYQEAKGDLTSAATYFRLQGLNPDMTPNPDYEKLLNADNLIDYMIIEYYTGDRDGPGSRYGNIPNNTFCLYNRVNPDGWLSSQHDSEHALGTGEENLVTPFTSAGSSSEYFNPQWLHEQLANKNAEYRLHFADHVQKHLFNDGLFTFEKASEFIAKRASQIDMAVIAESARWGDSKTNPPRTRATWLGAVNDVYNWMSDRTDRLMAQLKSVDWFPDINAPEFGSPGGKVSQGFRLTISNPNSGTKLYYTTDGSDPHKPGSLEPSANAVEYTMPILLNHSTHVKARVLGDEWSAITEAVFSIGSIVEDLRVTEIMYHPKVTSSPDDVNGEFVELTNIGDRPINLNLVRFTNGVDFVFPNIELAVGGYVVVVKDIDVFNRLYPDFTGVVAGQYTGSLANNGERIRLENAIGQVVMNIRYNDGWFDITDGDGFSLVLRDATKSGSLQPDDGLVAHWQFDETSGNKATDTVGGYTGTVLNNNGIPWKTGRFANCLKLDGNNDYLLVSSFRGITGTQSRTVTGWINTDVQQAGDIISWGSSSSGRKWLMTIQDTETTAGTLKLDISGGYIVGSTVLWDGNWHHIAAVFDNDGTPDVTDVRLYVDGESESIIASSPMTLNSSSSTSVKVGIFNDGANRYYGGMLDELSIYSRALSLEEIQSMADPVPTWDSKSYWRPSAILGGSPGFDDSGILPDPGSIVINEVLAHSPDDTSDWIELHNRTDSAIPVGGWFLSDSGNSLRKYEIASGESIPANGYIVFYQNDQFGNVDDPGCNAPFALSENGETVYLTSGQYGEITGYSNQENFGASIMDISLGRYQKSTGTFNFVALESQTPEAANSDPKVGPIVISEIMYHPQDDESAEYVELLNISGASVTLYDYNTNEPWRFTDDGGIEFFILDDSDMPVTIDAGERILLVQNITAFRSEFTEPGGTQIFDWGEGSLSNGGERVQLSMPGDIDLDSNERQYIRIDRVVYDDEDGWPVEPDGTGKSLDRKVDADYGNDVNNWQQANPTPGS